jgi:phosphoserine phosphatase
MKIELDKYKCRIEERLTTMQAEITPWTAQEFERLVLDSKPKVAVFDCDGTLWSGDSGSGFMTWSMEQGLVSRSTIDWIDTRYRAYLAGKVSELVICGDMVQMYEGLRDQELRAAAAQYVREFVHPRVFPELAALLGTLRHAWVELWAVSSTNRWVIAEGVREFGIPEERVLAAEVRLDGGYDHRRACGRAHRRRQGRHAQAGGIGRTGHGFWQLGSRSGHAETGAPRFPGESVASAACCCGQERLGLLHAASR